MGSMRLNCPLCCNETFSCHKSLRYHLLSIIDNLICPACNRRHDSILTLAEHLDRECCEEDIETTEATAGSSKDAGNSEVMCIKTECNDEDVIYANSILAKALLEPIKKKGSEAATDMNVVVAAEDNLKYEAIPLGLSMEMNNDDDNNEEALDENDAESYFCSGCAISFTSVEDHIRDFHEGQEVLVEDHSQEDDTIDQDEAGEVIELSPEDMISDLPAGATVIMAANVDNPNMMNEYTQHIITEEAVESDASMEGDDEKTISPVYHTLKEENCTDKDGRQYTRKVVQIERFWTKPGAKPDRVPVVQRYVMSKDGVYTKANDEELTATAAKNQFMDMFQCSSCLVQFSKMRHYEYHECTPEAASYYKCSYCDSLFNNNRSLRDHMPIHGVSKSNPIKGPFQCNVCDTEFPTNKSLRLHRRMHDPIKAKYIDAPVEYSLLGDVETGEVPKERIMFTCKVCNKVLDKGYEEIHMEKHSVEQQYNCDICNRKFFTATNLEMHMRVHSNDKTFTCACCKRSFTTSEALHLHMNEHCNSRPYQCQYCGRRFARPHEKVKHERIHTGEKPHECEICGKSFRVSYCLTLHMRTHSGYRPYVCKHCGKRFKAHSVYNHHLLTHSEERNYKCPYCPKAFKTGVQLAGHKNSHTKPFSCTECNRPFASLYAVRAHMETHKRENNLKHNCYLCGASYARAFALKDHIKEQHGEDASSVDNEEVDTQYQMIEEGMDATHSILPDDNVLLVEMVGETIDMSDANVVG